jgi:carboxypeptidase D
MPEHHGNLFFWKINNKHIADKPRLVIWLNGGPGCSSEDGALMEIGPYRVREGGKLEQVDGAWNEFATLLFVDNPVGTGFSYVDSDSYLHELTEMSAQFVQFLDQWFSIFPEYVHDDVSRLRLLKSDLTKVDLYCWRVICWTAHSAHCQGHSRPKQEGG